ncbi:MAG: hypothetical protein ACFWTZ_06830 [Burkholderia sp.]|jgi:hypothetical protein
MRVTFVSQLRKRIHALLLKHEDKLKWLVLLRLSKLQSPRADRDLKGISARPVFLPAESFSPHPGPENPAAVPRRPLSRSGAAGRHSRAVILTQPSPESEKGRRVPPRRRPARGLGPQKKRSAGPAGSGKNPAELHSTFFGSRGAGAAFSRCGSFWLFGDAKTAAAKTQFLTFVKELSFVRRPVFCRSKRPEKPKNQASAVL